MALKVQMREKSTGVFHIAPFGSIDSVTASILEGEVGRVLAAIVGTWLQDIVAQNCSVIVGVDMVVAQGINISS